MIMLPVVEPTLKMTRSDAFELMSLAKANLRGSPDISSFLIGEIGRAALVERDETRNVVTMNSYVEFFYGLTDQRRTVKLVYPSEADVAKAKISVMTPIGAALIGLSKGQSIEWRTSRGGHRFLKVIEVINDTNSNGPGP
jgi:regulator of nucleoside diphosphate kinase